jgi:8-oxo-dGTP pyrophosphatase MutT (NUDIX family)
MRFIERTAARVLVVSPAGRVLLLRLEPSFRDPFWVSPGGGLDEGESLEDGALRELFEEVGRDDLELGPCLWRRRVEFTWEDWRVTQHEHVFMAQAAEEFEPVFVHLDREPVTGSAWLSPAELGALGETVYPEGLAGLVTDLLRDGPPSSPIQLPDSYER